MTDTPKPKLPGKLEATTVLEGAKTEVSGLEKHLAKGPPGDGELVAGQKAFRKRVEDHKCSEFVPDAPARTAGPWLQKR